MPQPETLANVRRVNRALEGAWRSGLVPAPRLDSEALQSAALRGRSPEALGPDRFWREPLRLLTEALRTKAELNPLGKAMAYGQIVMALRARIRATALWQRRPHILDRPLLPPIIILGQMRSGTTRMQRLLACDDRLAHTRLFESLLPVPQFGRKLRAKAGLSFLRWLNPDIGMIHPTAAEAPEEEFGLFSFSLGSAQFEAQWRIPDFSRWWEEAPRTGLYDEFRGLLKTIDWSRRPSDVRPWVLKAPQFLQDLPALLDAFPGAALLHLQRDPKQIVASSASLVWNQMRIQSDHADRQWVGQEWLRKTRLREEIGARTLSARPDVPVLSVEFEAMNQDWRSEMQRIYDFLGLELTPALLRRMEHYLNRAKAHGGHCYDLGRFGLSGLQSRSDFERMDDSLSLSEPQPAPSS